MKIRLNNVRLSYPSLFKRATFGGDETKYEATFLFPKSDTAKKKEIDAAIKALIADKFKGKKVGADKLCLKDGDDFDGAGYEGHWSLKASNDGRPTVIDRDKTPLTADDNVVYAGCHVNAIIALWAQDNSYGRRINASLMGVQFVADGERFGGGAVASADEFEEVAYDESGGGGF